MEYRIEHDSMGTVKVPADRYWGAQTQRSHENFPIGLGHETMPEEIIHAFGILKKAAARANMDLLGVTPFAKKNYRALSGGQQQRVLLCRALCAAGEVLLLDEPTTGLDPLVTKELYTTIKHLSLEHGMTVIMVSHDVDAALRYSDRILHLATSLKFIGTPQDYLTTPFGAAFSEEGGVQNG